MYINFAELTRSCLEVAGGIVALRQENVVVGTALEWLVKWNRWAHELLLNLTEALKTGLDLQVVVRVSLGDGADNGDVVALGADVVCR